MRVVRSLQWGAATVWLSGCGGGVFIGFGSGFDDSPPSINLTTAASSVPAGQPVRFIAAASDENGIDHVSFYRIDLNGAVRLGDDPIAPYEWSVIAPTDGRSSLSVFARATDNNGNTADSPAITISVTP
jgi:hypothetical protein